MSELAAVFAFLMAPMWLFMIWEMCQPECYWLEKALKQEGWTKRENTWFRRRIIT